MKCPASFYRSLPTSTRGTRKDPLSSLRLPIMRVRWEATSARRAVASLLNVVASSAR